MTFRSLRKTTAEIQNYTYETGTEKPPDKDNTTSKDSGISQLSGIEALEETMEELSLQSSSSVSILYLEFLQLYNNIYSFLSIEKKVLNSFLFF